MPLASDKHRDELTQHPQKALGVWADLMHQARQESTNKQWRQASISYSYALDFAEIVFFKNTHESSRYLRTALELAYVLKQSEPANILESLTSHVQERLNEGLAPANTDLLIKPLVDLSTAPLHQAHLWMHRLFERDKQA